jgi:hypothetical protein
MREFYDPAHLAALTKPNDHQEKTILEVSTDQT